MAKSLSPGWRRSVSERELIALMGRLKAERLVKTVRGRAGLVRGQLHQPAAMPAALLDRPLEHRPANAAGAFARGDPHALDLAAPHAAPAEPGDEAELQNADDIPAAFGNREKLVRIALDRCERLVVAGVQLRAGVLAGTADRVVGEQRDDRWQIVRHGPAKGD